MKAGGTKPGSAGLICAGGVAQSFLARWPEALAAIGPVKASSLWVARRLANSLGAGRPVESFRDLAGSDPIWIALPERSLSGAIRDLAQAVPLRGTTVLLCDSLRGSAGFEIPGARVVTLSAIEPEERLIAAEGDPGALRDLRRLASRGGRRLIELHPGSKALFLAGIHFATHLTLPCAAAAVETLRAAGFSRADATAVAAMLGTRSFRAYSKGGERAWNPLSALELRYAAQHGTAAVRAADPRIGALYAALVTESLKYFGDSGKAASQS